MTSPPRPDGSAPHVVPIRPGAPTPDERRVALVGDPLACYERMVEIREAEAIIRQMASDGKAWGSVHSVDGQEAVSVGLAAAAPIDCLFTASHRTHGIALALGMNPESLFAELMGNSRGATRGLGDTAHMTLPSVGLVNTASIVGSQIPISVGHALAAQVRGRDAVAVCVFGDGAANIGAFHEGLNLAKVWNLGVVFVCENNMYGEHTHMSRSTPIADIASRGSAYDMPHAVVDGQDLDAVTSSVEGAIAIARRGGGPTLLEMKTYRYQPHARSDPVERPEGELEAWRRRDPIDIQCRAVRAAGHDDADIESVHGKVRADLAAALAFAESAAAPPPEWMFDNVASRRDVS